MVVQLTEWTRADERLMRAVRRGSVDSVIHLTAGREAPQPTKLDPSTGTTAYVL